MEDDNNAFLALGNNRYTREPEGLSLDVGSYVAALEYATGNTHSAFFTITPFLCWIDCPGRKAEIVGKPSAGEIAGSPRGHLAVTCCCY